VVFQNSRFGWNTLEYHGIPLNTVKYLVFGLKYHRLFRGISPLKYHRRGINNNVFFLSRYQSAPLKNTLLFIPLLWYFKGEIPLNSLWYFRPNTRYFTVFKGIPWYSRVFQPNLEFWNTTSDKIIFQFDYEILPPTHYTVQTLFLKSTSLDNDGFSAHDQCFSEKRILFIEVSYNRVITEK
jgi:hypothetical protein